MVAFSNERLPLFELGNVVATPGALRALQDTRTNAQTLLARHRRGDYGDMSDEDERLNDEAVRNGSRILSAYKLPGGKRIWIITEAIGDSGKRESTCLLLPDEY